MLLFFYEKRRDCQSNPSLYDSLAFQLGLDLGRPFLYFVCRVDRFSSVFNGRIPSFHWRRGKRCRPFETPGSRSKSTPQPELDLNQPAAHEQEPEPAPPLDDQDLLTKRKRVSEELRLLLQIGAVKRKNKIADQLLDWMGLDNETDRTLLDDLYNHLYDLSEEQGRRVGQPQMFSSKGIKSLKLWFLNRKER